MLDLERMLDRCLRDQWSVADLDWKLPKRPRSRSQEMAIVQYFTNMAGIERLAASMFEEQAKRATDPTLARIFSSFVTDEVRHARVAQLLADYYDVHHHVRYEPDQHFQRFYPAFVKAIRYLSPEVATIYMTVGELILDAALLRSLMDYVDDDLTDQAMELINRDESRHIAIDFHMVEHYSSEAYQHERAHEPRRSLGTRLAGWSSVGLLFVHARPFLRQVFFQPLDKVDPSGRRLSEAFRRIQLLALKPRVEKRPFARLFLGVEDLLRQPVVGVLLGRALIRAVGLDSEVAGQIYRDLETRRADRRPAEEPRAA